MLMLALALMAHAQDSTSVPVPDMNAQLYRPPIDAQRTLWTTDAAQAPHLWRTGRLYVNYIHGPMGAVFLNDSKAQVIGDVVGFDLVGGVQLGPVRVGIDAPLYVVATSDWEDLGGGGLGDIALDVKGTILNPADAPLGLALGARAWLPTATLNVPLGNPKAATEIQAIVDKDLGDIFLALNLGARLGPQVTQDNVELGNSFVSRLGVGYSITENAGVHVDFQSLVDFRQPGGDLTGMPIEGLIGGWGRLNDDIVLRGGVGTGFTDGIGSPAFRTVFSVGYEPARDGDRDMDGIIDAIDDCPSEPEDIDTYEDTDGCPDLDNDADGLLDSADACPMDPEDPDTWQDEDGCPDPRTLVRVKIVDPEGNEVPGVQAMIALDETDAKMGNASFEVELDPGTYAMEATAEGFEPISAKFQVPEGPPIDVEKVMTPAVELGQVTVTVVDNEGKPIEGATYAFGEDAEPKPVEGKDTLSEVVPGDYVVIARAEGFAPAKAEVTVNPNAESAVTLTLSPTKIKVSLEKIEILDKVFFDTAKTTIKKESFDLLDEVAQILKDRKDILKVRVEGHTDSRGSDASNMTLSEGRAASVRQYLIDAGVAEDRLVSKGFGETSPVDPAENREAWAKNRRVEFVIIEWAEDTE